MSVIGYECFVGEWFDFGISVEECIWLDIGVKVW